MGVKEANFTNPLGSLGGLFLLQDGRIVFGVVRGEAPSMGQTHEFRQEGVTFLWFTALPHEVSYLAEMNIRLDERCVLSEPLAGLGDVYRIFPLGDIEELEEHLLLIGESAPTITPNLGLVKGYVDVLKAYRTVLAPME